jgi:hypothetical protein
MSVEFSFSNETEQNKSLCRILLFQGFISSLRDSDSGRPKNRWEDDMINDVKKLKINNWTSCIQDRNKWKLYDKLSSGYFPGVWVLKADVSELFISSIFNRWWSVYTSPPVEDGTDRVPKRRLLILRRRGNTQKTIYQVLSILNMLHSPFFSSKCRLFHNATFFGSCIIQILHTGCAKIQK